MKLIRPVSVCVHIYEVSVFIFRVCVRVIALFGKRPARGCTLLGLSGVSLAKVYSGNYGNNRPHYTAIIISITYLYPQPHWLRWVGCVTFHWVAESLNNHGKVIVLLKPAHLALMIV